MEGGYFRSQRPTELTPTTAHPYLFPPLCLYLSRIHVYYLPPPPPPPSPPPPHIWRHLDYGWSAISISGKPKASFSQKFPALRIRDVYPGSRIRIFSSRSKRFWILDPICITEFKYFKQKNLFPSSLKYDPRCSTWIRILIFIHPGYPDPGVRKAPDPGSATLEMSWYKEKGVFSGGLAASPGDRKSANKYTELLNPNIYFNCKLTDVMVQNTSLYPDPHYWKPTKNLCT